MSDYTPVDTITDDVLDAILRESDGYWPPARERIQALIREHDAELIENLATEAEYSLVHHEEAVAFLRREAHQRREDRA